MAKILYLVEVRSGNVRFRIDQSLAPEGETGDWAQREFKALEGNALTDPIAETVTIPCIDVKTGLHMKLLMRGEMLCRDFYFCLVDGAENGADDEEEENGCGA